MSRLVGIFVRGMAMGAADVVPGVSGGTIALIVGIYEELIRTLSGLKPSLLGLWREQGFMAFWRASNLGFLLALLAGILTAIALLAQLVTYLMAEHPVPLWSFFAGLIMASVIMLLRPVRWDRGSNWLTFMLGIVIGFVVVSLPRLGGIEEPTPLVFFLSGALAICAMILPGISGSFILVILGMYAPVLAAVKSFDVPTLSVFALGCIIGLLCFVHLLRWLLERFHDAVLCLLVGFMAGSLVVLWPWRVPRDAMGNMLNVAPDAYARLTGLVPQVPEAMIAAAVGFVLVFLLSRLAGHNARIAATGNG